MSMLESDGVNPNRDLGEADYGPEGELETLSADLTLVVGSASQAEAFTVNRQWGLLWRDADFRKDGPL